MTDTRTADIRTADIRTAETTALPTVGVGPTRTVTVNGSARPWSDGLTVAGLVGELLGDDPAGVAGVAGMVGATAATAATAATGATGPVAEASCTPTGVAVALDDAIVPSGLWASTLVPADARVEVVTAVQGG